MDVSNLSNALTYLQSAGLYKPQAANPQAALFTQSMNMANAKQALSVIKAASRGEAPNSATASLREKLTAYFEGVLSGENQEQSQGPVTSPELEGLVERTIAGSLPFNDKQAFIGEVVRGFQDVAEKDRSQYIKDAATRLVQAEIDNPRDEEATPAEENRLRQYYQGLVTSLENGGLFGGGAGVSGLLDLLA